MQLPPYNGAGLCGTRATDELPDGKHPPPKRAAAPRAGRPVRAGHPAPLPSLLGAPAGSQRIYALNRLDPRTQRMFRASVSHIPGLVKELVVEVSPSLVSAVQVATAVASVTVLMWPISGSWRLLLLRGCTLHSEAAQSRVWFTFMPPSVT